MAASLASSRVYPVSRISSLPATTSAAVLFPFTVYFILISFVFVFLFIANQQGDNTASVPTCQQLFSVNVIFFCGLLFFFWLIELVEQGGGLAGGVSVDVNVPLERGKLSMARDFHCQGGRKTGRDYAGRSGMAQVVKAEADNPGIL